MIKDRIKELRRVKASELRPNPRNWRTHPKAQQDALRGVLAEVGYADALIARECEDGTLMLLDGHLRAETTPNETVPVLVLDVTEAEGEKILLTLDPLAAMAEADKGALESLLADLETDNEAMQAMLDELAKENGIVEATPEIVEDVAPVDAADELREKWGVEPGQIWVIEGKGTHRLMCGDSRAADHVRRLMGGNPVNLAFTSPPYASQRKYDESSGFKPIHPDDYVDWWDAVQECVKQHLADDGSFFINIKPCAEGLDTHLYVHDLVAAHVRRWGWHFATEFCWERTGVPKQVVRRFKNQFEPVYQFVLGEWKIRPESVRHPSGDVPMSLGKGSGNTGWADKQGKGGVIAANRRPRRAGKTSTKSLSEMQGTGCDVGDVVVNGMALPGNRLPPFTGSHEALGHAAAFPVGLPAWFITAYTDPGDIVYEPFSGSGSTAVAAEQTGRHCRAMEISPAYVAIALERMAKIGALPRLTSD